MAEARTYYDYELSKGLAWWVTREEIGQGLRSPNYSRWLGN
jgi:hypothetical protein